MNRIPIQHLAAATLAICVGCSSPIQVQKTGLHVVPIPQTSRFAGDPSDICLEVAFNLAPSLESLKKRGAVQFRAYVETPTGQTFSNMENDICHGDIVATGNGPSNTHIFSAFVFPGLKHNPEHREPPTTTFDLATNNYRLRCRLEVWSKPFPVTATQDLLITKEEVTEALEQFHDTVQ